MRPLSIRFKRGLVSLAVLVPILGLYLPFTDQPWSLYAALCAGYTLLVFGMLWSDGKWRKCIAANQRSSRGLVQDHVMFLLVLIIWIWICRISKPWLPDWMVTEMGRGLTYYLIFSGLGIVAIWWAEQSWLVKPAATSYPASSNTFSGREKSVKSDM